MPGQEKEFDLESFIETDEINFTAQEMIKKFHELKLGRAVLPINNLKVDSGRKLNISGTAISREPEIQQELIGYILPGVIDGQIVLYVINGLIVIGEVREELSKPKFAPDSVPFYVAARPNELAYLLERVYLENVLRSDTSEGQNWLNEHEAKVIKNAEEMTRRRQELKSSSLQLSSDRWAQFFRGLEGDVNKNEDGD